MNRRVLTVFDFVAVGALVAVFLWVALQEREVQDLRDRLYCDMTELFEQTGGELGWAPYRPEVDCAHNDAD